MFLELLQLYLGLSRHEERCCYRRPYRIIQDKADQENVSSHVASLLVARDYGIGYQRFVQDGDRAEMRGIHPARAPVPHDIQSRGPSPPARAAALPKSKPVKTTKNNSLFVVHGRDTRLNEDMFAFLRALGINPLEWTQAVRAARGANPNVTEIVKGALQQAQGVIVMFSPDEEARLRSKHRGPRDSAKLESQARLKVVFEAGIALGAHPDKTLLIEIGDVRKISDIGGMHVPRLTNSAASRKELAQRLRDKLKFKVDTSGDSWLTVGNFNR
jgi:predicted nucleotide-binding protein